MSARFGALFALSAGCWLIAISPAPTILRTPAALVALFLLPGLALLDALDLRRRVAPLGEALLVVGGSSAIVVLLTIGTAALDRPLGSDAGLRLPVLVVLAVTQVLLAIGEARRWLAVRHQRRTEPQGFAGGGGPRARDLLRRTLSPVRARLMAMTGVGLGLWLGAASLAAAAAIVSAIGGPDNAGVTQLWMVPDSDGARVGIYNGTDAPARYQLVVAPAGETGTALIVDVPAGQQWERLLPFPAAWRSAARVDATLFREAQSSPIRSTFLVPSPAPSP